ncbi:O-fucosyltransferase 39 [Asimina triloba]
MSWEWRYPSCKRTLVGSCVTEMAVTLLAGRTSRTVILLAGDDVEDVYLIHAVDRTLWSLATPTCEFLVISILKDYIQLELLVSNVYLFQSEEQLADLWSPLPNQGWKPCIDPTTTPGEFGLRNWRTINKIGAFDIERVAIYPPKNAFADIFDVDHFINALKDDIHIVRELPEEYSWSTREYYATAIRVTRIKTAPVHASANWYLENVLPVLDGYGIAAIAPFSHRLAFDDMPVDIQRLRCKVNFQALAFVPHINAMGDALVSRLRYPPKKDESLPDKYLLQKTDKHSNAPNGKFVVLHLRFDKDMAAHSACDFGGGKAEKLALAKYRQVIWQGRVLNSQFTDEELRSQGRCPLTPEEIGLLLAALGFDNSTRLYLASHKVYGGEARVSALRDLFPLMEDKKSLSSAEEREKISGKASLLAAVDYYVSMHSDVFISASPGNMHNALVGHRTYGNLKTIRPHMALLGQLFLNKSLGWSEFQEAVREGHKNRQGNVRLKKAKQSIYTYPAPDCMCQPVFDTTTLKMLAPNLGGLNDDRIQLTELEDISNEKKRNRIANEDRIFSFGGKAQ